MLFVLLIAFGIVPNFVQVLSFVISFAPLVWFIFLYPRRRCITWFELHDQSWIPEVFRRFVVEDLDFFWDRFLWGSFGGQAAKDIREAVRISGGQVLEICSGAGGGIKGLFNLLDNPNVCVTLSDLYPNPETWAALAKKHENLRYISKPVNALNIDPELKGLRLIRGAIHHFVPELVQSLVQDAVDKNRAFCSLDNPTQRFGQVANWLAALAVGLVCHPLLIGRCIKEGKFKSAALLFFADGLFWLGGWHDSIVSFLRSYHPSEFLEICSRVRGIEKFNVKAYNSSNGSFIQGDFFLVTPKDSSMTGRDLSFPGEAINSD